MPEAPSRYVKIPKKQHWETISWVGMVDLESNYFRCRFFHKIIAQLRKRGISWGGGSVGAGGVCKIASRKGGLEVNHFGVWPTSATGTSTTSR